MSENVPESTALMRERMAGMEVRLASVESKADDTLEKLEELDGKWSVHDTDDRLRHGELKLQVAELKTLTGALTAQVSAIAAQLDAFVKRDAGVAGEAGAKWLKGLNQWLESPGVRSIVVVVAISVLNVMLRMIGGGEVDEATLAKAVADAVEEVRSHDDEREVKEQLGDTE